MIDKNMKVNLKEILDKEFPDERYSEECYLCDPDKNDLCPKEVCHINGGPCWNTTNKEFEKKQTNKDIFLNGLDSEEVAEMIRIYTENFDKGCSRCPVPEEFCDRYFKFKDDISADRAEDENGEILTCEQIIERWLKEETSE